MLRIFDMRLWWTLPHDQDQMDLMRHIDFEPIQGHTHLFVADVTEEDEIMLKLLGCTVDNTIKTEPTIEGNNRILYKSDDKYLIIEVHHAILHKDK